MPSFSAVPEVSLISKVEPWGTSKRYSQNGSRFSVVVNVAAEEAAVADATFKKIQC